MFSLNCLVWLPFPLQKGKTSFKHPFKHLKLEQALNFKFLERNKSFSQHFDEPEAYNSLYPKISDHSGQRRGCRECFRGKVRAAVRIHRTLSLTSMAACL